MSSALTYFIIDNRQVSYQNFHVNSSYATYYRIISILIGKFCTLSHIYSWLNHPEALLVATSPDKVRLISKEQWNILQISELLEPKYTVANNKMIQKSTWNSYFVDGIQKVLINIKLLLLKLNSSNNRKQHNNKYNIIIISTDICCLGDSNYPQEVYDESIDKFCTTCIEAHQLHPNLRIRIICTTISDSTEYLASENNYRLLQIMKNLQSLHGIVTFHCVINSSLHFEDELKCILTQSTIPLFSKFEFSTHHSSSSSSSSSSVSSSCSCCSVVVKLVPSTGTAISSIHIGLERPEVYKLIARNAISPCFIEGKSFKVVCPIYKESSIVQSLLPTEGR